MPKLINIKPYLINSFQFQNRLILIKTKNTKFFNTSSKTMFFSILIFFKPRNCCQVRMSLWNSFSLSWGLLGDHYTMCDVRGMINISSLLIISNELFCQVVNISNISLIKQFNITFKYLVVVDAIEDRWSYIFIFISYLPILRLGKPFTNT